MPYEYQMQGLSAIEDCLNDHVELCHRLATLHVGRLVVDNPYRIEKVDITNNGIGKFWKKGHTRYPLQQYCTFNHTPSIYSPMSFIHITTHLPKNSQAPTPSIRPKIQPPPIMPQPLPVYLQQHHQQKRPRRNARLRPQGRHGPHGRRPRHLPLRDENPARRAGEVQPGGDLARGLGVGVERVGVDADGGDHDAEDVQAPAERGQHVGVAVLQREAEQHEPCDHEGCGDVDDP